MSEQRVKVADYIMEFLANKGIHKVFMLYGAANGHLVDAFTRVESIDYVAVMHEQAAGFAAEIYSRIRGVPGAALATSGPGGQNMVTAAANCFFDSVPCIFLTGQINSRFLRKDPTIRQVGFQESDMVSTFKPVTKHAVMITSPELVRYELEKAWHIATEGRQGPVLLDVPIDVQEAYIDPTTLVGFNEAAFPAAFDVDRVDAQIEAYLKDLEKAERPVILVGGGIRLADAMDGFRGLMDELQVPCFVTWNGLDAVTSDWPQYGGRVGTYGGAGRNFGVQNSDLLFAMGCRISGRITGGNVHTFAREAKKYVVDVDQALLQPHLQEVPCDVNIHCELNLFFERFRNKLATKKYTAPKIDAWRDQVQVWRKKYDPVDPKFLEEDGYTFEGKNETHPYAFVRRLGEMMDDDAIVIGDHGGVSAVIGHALELKSGHRYCASNGNAPMGYSFAAAMGAYMAAPERQVIALIGDGGMNVNIQELQTMVNYGIKVKTFVLNNHIYGITKAYQETNFEGRCEACGPAGYNPPDFVKVAEAYGVKAFRINCNAEIDEVTAEALAYDGPAVIDVVSHEFHTYEPRIFGWKTPIEDMYPYLPRDEFRANMYIEPHETWENPVYPNVVSGPSNMP